MLPSHHRSARIQCSTSCSSDPNCEAYYFQSLTCHLGRGAGLTAAIPGSSATKTIYIDNNMQPGNESVASTFVILCTIISFAFNLSVNCAWGAWAPSQSCSKSCGVGIQQRTRVLAVQASNGGRICAGNNTDISVCRIINCPGPSPGDYFLASRLQSCEEACEDQGYICDLTKVLKN